ncbi:hypothetical protein Tco_0304392 [Tanacetum coccineum]
MGVELGLKNAAPGMIIRKRKQFGETGRFKPGNSDLVELSFAGVDIAAEDAVALLLRHFRGVQAMHDEVMHIGEGDLTDLCRAKKITILQWVLMIHSTQQFFGGAAVVTTS